MTNVLIIDSNPIFTRTLKDLILEVSEQDQVQVCAAHCQTDLIEILELKSFNTIFLDIDLPWLKELTNRFVDACKNINIIGLTFFPENYPPKTTSSCSVSRIISKSQIEANTILETLDSI